ncbi:enoyl-CoA hydratase-related protein [Alkalihalobacillus macyae]|uniref:enoyl-CoA hydratase-related protein n=1 Tax=Guptibacillus hwajinpoensis TaxID=208199 RepID=UPI00273B8A07|nr:enoyl-CoA hydratase-related protein [Alkalihalobacillus macyae]MDP4551780.1 enoyl-CoA hydratase-related protein [Alkalihalobacillus macyae]
MAVVTYEVKNHIGYVTLNRPDVLNCFNFDTLSVLQGIVDDIYSDRDVRAVIFMGSGERAFSAGADLKERRTLTESEVRRNVKKIREVFTAVESLPQPTIAALNGYAFGGGFELALACDFRYAVEGTKMGLTETSLGIIPGAGGTQRLPRLIGIAKAMELVLTARKLSSEEAYDYGILNGVVHREKLLATCEELATEICRNAPVAVQQAKFAVREGMNVDRHTGMAIESKAYEVTIPTKDRIEALDAFSEKRKPEFKGE